MVCHKAVPHPAPSFQRSLCVERAGAPLRSVSLPALPSSHSHTAFQRSAIQLLLSPGDARSHHCVNPRRHLRTVSPGSVHHWDTVHRQRCACRSCQCSGGREQQGRTGRTSATDCNARHATLCPCALNAQAVGQLGSVTRLTVQESAVGGFGGGGMEAGGAGESDR